MNRLINALILLAAGQNLVLASDLFIRRTKDGKIVRSDSSEELKLSELQILLNTYRFSVLDSKDQELYPVDELMPLFKQVILDTAEVFEGDTPVSFKSMLDYFKAKAACDYFTFEQSKKVVPISIRYFAYKGFSIVKQAKLNLTNQPLSASQLLRFAAENLSKTDITNKDCDVIMAQVDDNPPFYIYKLT